MQAFTYMGTKTQTQAHPQAREQTSPVGFGKQNGRVRFPDEIFISNFADSDNFFLPAG